MSVTEASKTAGPRRRRTAHNPRIHADPNTRTTATLIQGSRIGRNALVNAAKAYTTLETAERLAEAAPPALPVSGARASGAAPSRRPSQGRSPSHGRKSKRIAAWASIHFHHGGALLRSPSTATATFWATHTRTAA